MTKQIIGKIPLSFFESKNENTVLRAIYLIACDRDWIYGAFKCENSKALQSFGEQEATILNKKK